MLCGKEKILTVQGGGISNNFRYTGCSTCWGSGSANSQECTVCADGHALMQNTNNCFTIAFPPDKYYYDPSDNLIKPCYTTCESCSKAGDASTHN